MNFETLYKRTKTGAIQQWSVRTEKDIIIKNSGKLNGALVTHHEQCMGKHLGKSNETTPEEQAILQATSDIKRKQDEGYKTLSQLGVMLAPESFNKYIVFGIDSGTLEEALTSVLPLFNTDASGNCKPMLAKTLDWTKVQYPCLVQPKLDGVRCMMIVDPDNSEIRFLSRSGKEYTTLGHVKDHVQDWLVNYPNVEDLKKFILDGEIYSDKLTFQEIVAAVKKQRPDSLKLGFRVYDTVDTDTIQMNRIIDKAGLVMSIDSEHITDVPSQLALKADDVKMFYALYMKDGYEGAMVRHVKGAYEQGQRSSDLLKLKEFDSTEFAFIQFEKGLRDEDLIALCETEKGLYFKAKMAGTVKEKKSFEEFEYALRNTAVTVKHFGYTDDGLPRFPVGISFRDYE